MSNLTLRAILRAQANLPTPEERRAVRERAGTSRGQVAAEVRRRSGKSCSGQAVAFWESGARTPSAARLVAYVEVLEEMDKHTRRVPA